MASAHSGSVSVAGKYTREFVHLVQRDTGAPDNTGQRVITNDHWQTGFLYDYAFAMIIGLIVILAVWVAMVP